MVISSQIDTDDNFDELYELKSILVLVGGERVDEDVLDIVL